MRSELLFTEGVSLVTEDEEKRITKGEARSLHQRSLALSRSEEREARFARPLVIRFSLREREAGARSETSGEAGARSETSGEAGARSETSGEARERETKGDL